MRFPIALTVLGGLLAGLLAAPGCSDDPNKGYSTASLYDPKVKTICLPAWQRGHDVYRQNVELQLTEAIQKAILQTPYRLADRAWADTELTGSLDSIEQRPLSINPDTGRPFEMEITMIASFKWTDLRTGKVRRENKIKASGRYMSDSPFNEDFFVGNQDVMSRLAKLLVEQLQIPMSD